MNFTEPILQPGVNFTNRAELKYAHAAHLSNVLRGRIDEWWAAETLLARIHQVDAHTIEFRLVVKREPPIDEWSLILGDALHNLRSVFDTVIWGLATLDGAEPRNPGQVGFPVTLDEADWNRRIRSLESVPKVYLDRIRALQPWVESVDRSETMLWLLHRFDIVDKHQGLISGFLHFKQLSTAGLELNLEPANTAASAQPTISIRESPIQLTDDVVLTTFHCATHTLNPDPKYLAKVWVQFSIETEDRRRVLINKFVGDLLSRTREWLDRIYGGDVYAKGLIAARTAADVAAATFGYKDEEGNTHITQLPMGNELVMDEPG